ncbi:MAG: hypothetical protein VX265_16300 [Myxococcota bacterium]|nr:hypothetical protein [Myxococcota bacterium]
MLESSDQTRLFTHSRRPQWGVGLLTAEGENRRSLRFQDGKLRSFRSDFYHLLDEFEGSDAVIATVASELQATHDAQSQVERRLKQAAEQPPLMTFDEQVRVFEHLFPGGFTGPTWQDEWRAPIDETSARKRHVNPAVALATETLSAEHLADKTGEEVLALAIEVLKLTKLASPSKLVKPLADAGDTHESATEIGNAIRELLHGEGKFEDRLRTFVMTVDAAQVESVTWPLVTLIPALAQPHDHVAVQHRPFALQARSLDPSAAVPKAPSPIGYSRFQKLAQTVRDRLTQRGHTPADLIDVRGFIWETLRPRGVQALDQIKL